MSSFGLNGLTIKSDAPKSKASTTTSSCPILDAQGHLTEFGVTPDVRVDMDEHDRTHDAILDTAIALLTASTTTN